MSSHHLEFKSRHTEGSPFCLCPATWFSSPVTTILAVALICYSRASLYRDKQTCVCVCILSFPLVLPRWCYMYGLYIYCLALRFLNIMSGRFFHIVHKKLSLIVFWKLHCPLFVLRCTVYLLRDIGFLGLLL